MSEESNVSRESEPTPESETRPIVRVLIAERSADDARRIREMLEGDSAAHFQPFVTDDVEASLQILQDEVVDVMLLDLTLEEELGLQAIRALRRFGLSPERLQLELTESGLVQDAKAVRDALAPLRALGLPIAIDDLGTGHSSLTALRDCPVDGLKIDRAFARRMADDPVDRTIVATVVGLANGLGMRLLAEGTETSEQRDALLRLGCRNMQGFLLSKALSEEPNWAAHVDGRLEFDEER